MSKKIRRGADGLPLQGYLITYRCRVCAVKFKAEVYDGDPDPTCPNLDCGAVQTPVGMDVAEGRAPSIGGSLVARATDAAAQMVMEDHKMTDLQDATREGDTMAPRLTIAQQRVADGMFSAQKRQQSMGQGGGMAAAMNRIARQGVGAASALVQRDSNAVDPIAAIHSAKVKPPIHVVNRG